MDVWRFAVMLMCIISWLVSWICGVVVNTTISHMKDTHFKMEIQPQVSVPCLDKGKGCVRKGIWYKICAKPHLLVIPREKREQQKVPSSCYWVVSRCRL